jgi:hypothetical protein
MPRITLRAARQRAWRDTLKVFDLHDWPKLLARLAVMGISLALAYGLVGAAGVVSQMGEFGTVAVALFVVSVLWFLVNLWWAPARLANEAKVSIEQRETELQRRLEMIDVSRPKVELIAEGHSLVVVNEGATADFRAQLEVSGNTNFPIPIGTIFHGLWARTQKHETTLFSGDRDQIRLGSFSPTSGQPAGALLTFHYFNVSGQNPRSKAVSYILETKHLRPILQLKVSIVSDPALGTPIIRDVELRPEGVVLLG